MAISSREEVLRLKRTDHKTAHLVLHVADHSTSQDALDLKLIGTDSDYLYHGNVKESALNSLQATNFKGNLAEFKTVLSYALLRRRPDASFPDVLEGVETVAAISGQTLTVTIRKNISGITQKLAAITLQEDTEREEVTFIEWTDAVLNDRDELQDQLATAQEKAKEQQAQVAKLSAELDKLVKAKKQHEEEMLSKFAALLNAKKLKIRDQQRLLSSVKIDVDAAEEVEEARSSSAKSSRRAGASRKGKRKAHGTAKPTPPEAEDEDGDDATADGTDDAQEEDRRRQETPETDEEDVADEDGEVEADGSGMANAIDGSQTTRRVVTKQTQQSQRSQRSSEKMDVDKQKSPSPQRKLPSRKAKSPAKEPSPPPHSNDVNDEAEDETDDEL